MDNSTSPYMRALMRVLTVKTGKAKPRKRSPSSFGRKKKTISLRLTLATTPLESLPQDPRTEDEFLASWAGRIYEPGSQSYPDE